MDVFAVDVADPFDDKVVDVDVANLFDGVVVVVIVTNAAVNEVACGGGDSDLTIVVVGSFS